MIDSQSRALLKKARQLYQQHRNLTFQERLVLAQDQLNQEVKTTESSVEKESETEMIKANKPKKPKTAPKKAPKKPVKKPKAKR